MQRRSSNIRRFSNILWEADKCSQSKQDLVSFAGDSPDILSLTLTSADTTRAATRTAVNMSSWIQLALRLSRHTENLGGIR